MKKKIFACAIFTIASVNGGLNLNRHFTTTIQSIKDNPGETAVISLAVMLIMRKTKQDYFTHITLMQATDASTSTKAKIYFQALLRTLSFGLTSWGKHKYAR